MNPRAEKKWFEASNCSSEREKILRAGKKRFGE
jgi:hypothetical protein